MWFFFFIFCLVSFIDKLAAQRDIMYDRQLRLDSDADGKTSLNVLGAWKVAPHLLLMSLTLNLFSMSLVYYICLFSNAVHGASTSRKIRCFEFCYLEFLFGYLENSLLQILLAQIFKKDCELFA